MTSTNSNNQGLLSSWKEIASYLNCDERTCRRYEQNFGLPIHRMEGTPKSRVFAYRDELDAWRRERLNGVLNANEKELSAPKQHGSKAAKMLIWILPLLVVIIAAAIFLLRPSPGQPADFRIEKSDFVVLDKKGKELWRYPTGKENLLEEKFYKRRFQIRSLLESGYMYLPLVIIMDLDNNQKAEVLFTKKTKNNYGEGELFCFDYKGRQLWKFTAGREWDIGGRIFSADYRISGFDVSNLDNDGNLEIIVISIQMPQWPCQLAVLDHKGELLGEYWNAGHFLDTVAVDLNEDGEKEILATGTNNEHGRACLAVFDPANLNGGSPQLDDRYKFPGIPTGSELYYILLPRTDVDLAENYSNEAVMGIDLLKNKKISFETSRSLIYFEFGFDLVPKGIQLSSHFFEQKHSQAVIEGKVTSVLNDEYWENLKRNILYWDGTEWTSTPATNRNWNNPR
jgi:hypothetical protein